MRTNQPKPNFKGENKKGNGADKFDEISVLSLGCVELVHYLSVGWLSVVLSALFCSVLFFNICLFALSPIPVVWVGSVSFLVWCFFFPLVL